MQVFFYFFFFGGGGIKSSRKIPVDVIRFKRVSAEIHKVAYFIFRLQFLQK